MAYFFIGILAAWSFLQSRKILKLEEALGELKFDNAALGVPAGISKEKAEQIMREHLRRYNPEGLAMYDEFLKNQTGSRE